MVAMRADPYHDRKIYHMADKVNGKGGVSALCFGRLQAINLRVVGWVTREDAVTCPKCLKIISQRKVD